MLILFLTPSPNLTTHLINDTCSVKRFFSWIIFTLNYLVPVTYDNLNINSGTFTRTSASWYSTVGHCMCFLPLYIGTAFACMVCRPIQCIHAYRRAACLFPSGTMHCKKNWHLDDIACEMCPQFLSRQSYFRVVCGEMKRSLFSRSCES